MPDDDKVRSLRGSSSETGDRANHHAMAHATYLHKMAEGGDADGVGVAAIYSVIVKRDGTHELSWGTLDGSSRFVWLGILTSILHEIMEEGRNQE